MHAPAHTHDPSRGRVHNTVDSTNWMWTIADSTVVMPAVIRHARPMGMGAYMPSEMRATVLGESYSLKHGPFPITVKKGACTITVYTRNMPTHGMHGAATANVPELPILILVLDVWNSAGEPPTKIFASIAQIPGHLDTMSYAMDAVPQCPFFPEVLQLSSSNPPYGDM